MSECSRCNHPSIYINDLFVYLVLAQICSFVVLRPVLMDVVRTSWHHIQRFLASRLVRNLESHSHFVVVVNTLQPRLRLLSVMHSLQTSRYTSRYTNIVLPIERPLRPSSSIDSGSATSATLQLGKALCRCTVAHERPIDLRNARIQDQPLLLLAEARVR